MPACPRLLLRVPTFAALVTAQDAGIYAAFRLHPKTVKNIEAWAKAAGIRDRLVDTSDLHVTTVYSKKAFSFEALGQLPLRTEFQAFAMLGEDMLVAVLDSLFLQKLFEKRRAAGADWDYPLYVPHISLSKNVTKEEMAALPPFTFPVMLTEEYSNPLEEDWSYDETKADIDTSAARNRIQYYINRDVRFRVRQRKHH